MALAPPEIETALEAALGGRVAAVEHRPFAYATSHALTEVDAVLDDGTIVELVLKDGGALADGAADAKPAFLRDARREVAVYRRVLGRTGAEAPRLYASGRTWLLLERVQAPPLTEVGELSTWESAARRIAAMHELVRGRLCPHLLRYDSSFYLTWRERARAFHGPLGSIERAHAIAAERLAACTPTVIHGELYASNVLTDGERIWVLDWETAGLGAPLVDLAALTSGSWDDDARRALALAYRSAMAAPPPLEDFLVELECARLHLAVQWLGWSRTWTPPPWQQHDWRAEAERAAERIR